MLIDLYQPNAMFNGSRDEMVYA